METGKGRGMLFKKPSETRIQTESTADALQQSSLILMLGMNDVPVRVLCFPQVKDADELGDGDPHGRVGHIASGADTVQRKEKTMRLTFR